MSDWTKSADGHANSAPEFLRLVDEVARLIRGQAHALIQGDTESVSRLVLAQLAHKHGLSPAGQVDVERLAVALEDCASLTGDDAQMWAPIVAAAYDGASK